MREFFNVVPPDEALATLLDRLDVSVRGEVVQTAQALGRVTAEDLVSPEDMPPYPRSTMDGYSVRARDTFGASESLPAFCDVVGEVAMGSQPQVCLSTGQAAVAYTGGMLADGADAVVMVENTQRVGDGSIEILRPVAPGENVIQVGEDTEAGDTVIPKGQLIRAQDVGVLFGLGITQVAVAERPRVAIISTGDELVPPEGSPGPGQVRDINSYSVAALVEDAGGLPVHIGLVPDDYPLQRQAAMDGLERGDVLVFSAGSSVSSRDMTVRVLDELGPPGVLVHGIAHKPGKPTIVALVNGRPAFGLPGNPVSAMVVFGIVVRPVIQALMGRTEPPVTRGVHARLTKDIRSATGREDHVQVKLIEGEDELLADPVFGKSNLISTLVEADGVVVVPLDDGGLYAGDEVFVRLY
ncbi:MAG: molybdopterin molybdenumtransferase MoeA [Dehalococcoidia bacterium]|nr:molybdopterin molybdenumtransferase MoeA [Dehalococcoidia bacterium]